MKSTFLRFVLAALCLLLLPACDRITQTRAQNAFERGLRLERSGDLPGAITEFSQALSRNPKHVEAYIRRAACRAQNGEIDGALADADAAIGLDPRSSTAHTTRGTILVRRKEPEAALVDYDRAITLDPQFVWAYQNRGILKRTRRDFDGAIADFNQAIALDPNNAVSLETRGTIMLERGDTAAALADFDRALEIDSGRASTYAGRGSVKARTGDEKGALTDFDRALDLDSDFVFAYRSRAQLHMKQARWDAALRDFRTACAKSSPDEDYLRIFMWICQNRTGAARVAADDLTIYMQSRPAATAGDWVSKIAAHLLGTLEEKDLLTAAAVAPDKTTAEGQLCEAWYYAGIKKALAGDTPGATAAFQKCLDTGITSFVEYHQARAELERAGKGAQ